ncbi:MAG: type II secretion system protein GspG [Patescibacteria group bacterium]
MKKQGFTLLELMTVMAILTVLAGIIFSNFTSALSKGRDSKRKQDLDNIGKALEVYYSENNVYPTADPAYTGGMNWSQVFQDTRAVPKVYMQKLPQDPVDNGYNYVLQSDGTSYKLYSCLENNLDYSYNEINPNPVPNCGVKCGNICNYGISSGNAVP